MPTMNDGRLKHKLPLAMIVLALWTTDVVASAGPRCMRAGEWLYDLSVEQLMDIPIDGDLSCDADVPEVLTLRVTAAGASLRGWDSRKTSDEDQVSPKSIVLDDVDYGR